MKRIISIILCVALVLAMLPTALAAETSQSISAAYTIKNELIESQATTSQNVFYSSYDVDLSAIRADTNIDSVSDKEVILSICTLANTEIIGENTVQSFNSEYLSDYLYNCSEITDISILNQNSLYICYNSFDDKSVILCYADNGLKNKSVYDNTNDTAYFTTDEESTFYQNFRAGSHYEMTEEVETEIDTIIESGNLSELTEIEGIDVFTHADGTISIEPQSLSSSTPSNFSSQSELLAHLKSRFAPYTNVTKAHYTRYSNQLAQNITVRINESRNAYARKSYDYESFVVGTAITLISSFLGPSTSVTVRILTALGVGISATDTILSAVNLYRSAVYTYTGSRVGYVYDTTVHDEFVRIVTYSSKGEFTGGYNGDDVFDWVHSTVCSAFDREYSDIADTAKYYYDSELLENGACIDYVPD